MTDSQDFTYSTRSSGEVEIMRDGSLAVLLRGDDAENFLAEVKKGDADQVMARFVGGQSETTPTAGADTHPAMEKPLDGPVPHGDGEIREVDGEERPSD